MRIYCGAAECKYNDEKNKCTRKTIHMNEAYYHTVNEGMRQFWVCREFEEDPKYIELIKAFYPLYEAIDKA